MKALVLSIVLSALIGFASADASLPFDADTTNPVVSITGGLIQGSQDNFSYYFKGVPFAAPPVGALRFKDPEPLATWTGVKQTTAFSAGCIQQCILPRPSFTCPATTSEDCLYLNVFTPTTNNTANLPVMAWIHGGAFLAGAGGTTLYEASQLAQREQMVIVTSNYRLGVFGALYNGNDITGNFMLKDQRMVLQWIQANIKVFGGDPTRVTISGQSAGAISVACHLTSPLSHGLYQSAIISSNPFGIMMSSMPLMTWLHNQLATAVGCSTSSGSSSLACLQGVDAQVLLNASGNAAYVPLPDYALASILPWVPVVTEDDQLPVQPLYAADPINGTIPSNVNVMIGTVAQDGLFFIYEAIESDFAFWIVKLLLDYLFSSKIADQIEQFYGPYTNSSDMHQWVGKVLTDYMFFCPTRYFSRSMVANRNSTVYGWYLGQIPSFSAWIWGDSAAPGCVDAVCHSDDLPYVFRSNVYGGGVPTPTQAELQMVDMIQDAYGTFISTGGKAVLPKPGATKGSNGSSAFKAIHRGREASSDSYTPWPPMYVNGRNHLLLDWLAPTSVLMEGYRDEVCDYFDSIGYNRY